MRHSLLLLFVFIAFNNSAQYLNIIHVDDSLRSRTYSYNDDGSHLVSFDYHRDSALFYNSSWSGIGFKKFDDSLNIIESNSYKDYIHFYYPPNQASYVDSSYFIATHKTSDYDTTKGIVMRFDTSGNFMWEKRYFPSYKSVRMNVLRDRGDTLFIAGSRCNICSGNPDMEGFLIALDTAGTELWIKTFPGAVNQPIELNLTMDGGFVLSSRIWNTSFFVYKTRCYKLDSVGNIEWSQVHGNNNSDDVAGFIEMPNGNFLFSGGSTTGAWNMKAWMGITNPTGFIIRDTIFDLASGDEVFYSKNAIFKPGGFQLFGGIEDGPAADTLECTIAFIDTMLNIQWMKRFHARNYTNHFVYQKPLDNGFTLIAGIAGMDDVGHNFDDWFLIVDSIGCNVATCNPGPPPVPEPIPSIEPEFPIWPNPVEDYLHIHSDTIIGKLEVYDNQGKLVTNLIVDEAEYHLNCSFLACGMYVLRFNSNRYKFVKI